MPISSKYLFVASLDVHADKEALFNEIYDTEHIPNLLKVPGVRAVTRMPSDEGEDSAAYAAANQLADNRSHVQMISGSDILRVGGGQPIRAAAVRAGGTGFSIQKADEIAIGGIEAPH
jgi:hypothetical protein